MEALAVYIFGAILGTTQLALVAYQWHSRRDKTKAEATQITANSFDTLTKTITTMATDFSRTLMGTIELVNSREKRIDELEDDNRTKTNDIEDLRDQLNDSINANVQRDTKAELQQKSIDDLVDANKKQARELENLKEDHARELIELKARILGLQDDNKKKDDALADSNRQLDRKDERIRQLEKRVEHLESEIETLKKPVVVVEEKAVEVKVEEPKTEGVNPS